MRIYARKLYLIAFLAMASLCASLLYAAPSPQEVAGNYEVAQLVTPPLISPQQRKMPIYWFRRPFGQMRKEIMQKEMDERESRMISSIQLPPNLTANITPFSQTLYFSAYTVSLMQPVRRARSIEKPGSDLRLTPWFYLREGEAERQMWWESELRSVIIQGLVFQSRTGADGNSPLGSKKSTKEESIVQPPFEKRRKQIITDIPPASAIPPPNAQP